MLSPVDQSWRVRVAASMLVIGSNASLSAQSISAQSFGVQSREAPAANVPGQISSHLIELHPSQPSTTQPDFNTQPDFYNASPLPIEPPRSKERISSMTMAERAPFRFGTSFTPKRSTRDGSSMLSVLGIESQIGFPLRTYPDGILLSLSSLKYTGISTDAKLPVSGTPIPDELWDLRSGVFLSRERGDGLKYGGLLNFGSASDQPFESADELTVGVLGFLGVPTRGNDSWEFSVFYSPTSQIKFPIPGIAYAWRPNDQLEAQIGLPASLTYVPNESFSFRARYTPLTDVFIEARQEIARDWNLFARYQIINETYFLADREKREDRFFQFEQQLAAGLSRQLPSGFSLDLGSAYVFDRQFFQSDQFDLGSADRIKIDPGVAYFVQLVWNR
jgi:hypothetical protein